MTTFAEATAVAAVGSHTYTAHFPDDWCVGTVPHGGFVTSTFLRVARTHFATTLAAQNQPHTITLHLEFLRRTQVGPATFTVQDAKLGRQTSVIHVSLSQDGRSEVVGYITNSNMDTETGVSLSTGWALEPAPPPVDLDKLAAGKDENWEELKARPFANFRKVGAKVHWHLPRHGQAADGLADEWLRPATGEKFTNDSLGVVADLWPQLVEALRARDQKESKFWYPTLLLNLDVKKALPAAGVDWLFARVRAKRIRNGRQDLEVVVADAAGEVVALSHQVALVLGAERNTAQRRGVSSL